MIRKDIEVLLRHIEPQIVGILISHGLVTASKRRFANISLTQRGKAISNLSDILITEEWLKKWQLLWPPNFRGSRRIIRDKLNRFLLEHDTTLENIIAVTESWLVRKRPPYCGEAKYFFYKIEKDGTEISRCEECLELIEDIPEDDNDVNMPKLMMDEDY